MNEYNCMVSNIKGKTHKFTRLGVSVETLQAGLQSEGFYPISISKKTQKRISGKSRISHKTIADFTALLSILLDSGLGVKDSLEVLKTTTGDLKVKTLSLKIEKDLKAGLSLFSSINDLRPSIPDIYASMVRVGETTGDLASIFIKLNDYLVRQKAIREKFVSSLIYPVIVLFVAVLSMILISTLIIPKIAEMFTELGSKMPPEVSRVLSFSKGFFIGILAVVILVIIMFTAFYFVRRRNSSFAVWIDRMRLKVPFLGKLNEDNHFLNILFTLDALTSCGITVEDSINEVINTSGNAAIRESLKRAHERVLKGVELSEALDREAVIPDRISKWIAVGERTGSMGKVFGQLSGYYENELEKRSSRFMSLIEPALIIFTGLIVFGIVMLIIVPLFSTFGMLLE